MFSGRPPVGGGYKRKSKGGRKKKLSTTPTSINPANFANVMYLLNATGDVTGNLSGTLYATAASSFTRSIIARNSLASQPHDGVTKFQSFAMEGNGSTFFIDSFNNGITGGTLGNGQFTMECWCYPSENGNYELMSTRASDVQSPDTGIGLMMNTTTNELRVIRGNGEEVTSGTALNLSAWNHVAVTRDSSNSVRAFVNGALGLTYTDTRNYQDQALTIMDAQSFNGGARWKGYIEDVRITKGECFYTAAVSVPTAAFPTS